MIYDWRFLKNYIYEKHEGWPKISKKVQFFLPHFLKKLGGDVEGGQGKEFFV
jgi:hypothetical protein